MKKLLFISIIGLLSALPSQAMTRRDAIRTAEFIIEGMVICNRLGIKTRVRAVKIQYKKGSRDYRLMINGEKSDPNYFYIKIRGNWVNVGCLLKTGGYDEDFMYLKEGEE